MSNIPDYQDGGTEEANIVDDHRTIIHHVLKFVYPEIELDNYNILKPSKGFARHSIKISVSGPDIKRNIFEGCKKFKNLDRDSFMKKIFIKNDDPPPPLTRKEYERLYLKMKELREAEEDPRNPVNRYHIKVDKLYKNGNSCIDEFNMTNQLFL